MVQQTSQAMVRSKGFASKSKKQFWIKQCLFCNHVYKGSKQSVYCSDYCVQRACRRRREALIEALAALFCDHSGVPLTLDHAVEIAANCVKQNHQPFKLKLEQCGYVYQEREKVWQRQALLTG